MHDTDIIPVKAAIRQMGERLKVEYSATKQWESFTRHRGISEVAEGLEEVASAMKRVEESIESVLETMLGYQEIAAREHAEEHRSGHAGDHSDPGN